MGITVQLIVGIIVLSLSEVTLHESVQKSKKHRDVLSRIPTLAATAMPGDLYSSLSHMYSLFAFDTLLGPAAKILPNPSLGTQNYLTLYKYLEDDIDDGDADELPESITGNPLHIYALIKRLVQFSPAVFQDLNLNRNYNHDLRMAIENLDIAYKLITLPTVKDFSGAALALCRLAHVYRLNLDDMTKGMIQNVHSTVRLSVLDCLHISNESFYDGQYSSAYVWNEQALSMTRDPELRFFILSHSEKILVEHDANWVPKNEYFFPLRLSERNRQSVYDTPFYELCRGHQGLNSSEVSKLFCHISDRGNPYLKLMPVHYEQLHYDPEMYMFYDMISSTEAKVVQKHAHDKLVRSLYQLSGSKKLKEGRVSHSAYLNCSMDPVLVQLGRRVQEVTGLLTFETNDTVVQAGEPLKVLSYGIGGHIVEHYDMFAKLHTSEFPNPPLHWTLSGERMATWIYILKAPEAGGFTAFAQARVAVKPTTGAGLLFFNTKRNGEGNQLAQHGGCPVLIGHKWVGNKWIREHPNFLTRPCSLDPGT